SVRVRRVRLLVMFVVTLTALGACGSSSKQSLSGSEIDRRCSAVVTNAGADTSTNATIRVWDAQSALRGAHTSEPAWLASATPNDPLAVCEFTTTSAQASSPTTICPNGDSAAIGSPPRVHLVAVDAHSNTVELPAGSVPNTMGPVATV